MGIVDPDPTSYGLPPKQALYDPAFEKDACGVGFVVSIEGIRTNQVNHFSIHCPNKLHPLFKQHM